MKRTEVPMDDVTRARRERDYARAAADNLQARLDAALRDLQHARCERDTEHALREGRLR